MKESENLKKPSFLPLTRQLVGKKLFTLKIEEGLSSDKKGSFLDKIATSVAAIESEKGAQKGEKPSQRVVAARWLSLVTSIMRSNSTIPLVKLALMELPEGETSKKKLEKNNYVDYSRLIQGKESVLMQKAVKKKKVRERQEGATSSPEIDSLEEQLKQFKAKGSTNLQDLDFYSNGDNIFKKGTDNAVRYGNAMQYQQQLMGFDSLLRFVGKDRLSQVRDTVKKLRGIAYDLDSVPEPFKEAKGVEAFSIHKNHHSLLLEGGWEESWSEEDFFSVIFDRWGADKAGAKVRRYFTGSVYDHFDEIKKEREKALIKGSKEGLDTLFQAQELIDGSLKEAVNGSGSEEDSTEEKVEKLSLSLLKEIVSNPEKIKQYGPSMAAVNKDIMSLMAELDETDQYLDSEQKEQLADVKNRGEKKRENEQLQEYRAEIDKKMNAFEDGVPDPMMLLPVGVYFSMVNDVVDQSNLGFWGDPSDNPLSAITGRGFIEKGLSGYLNYVQDDIRNGFFADRPLSAKDLAIDNIEYGEKVRKELMNKGFLDRSGKITDRFNNESVLSREPQENKRLMAIFRRAKEGTYSLLDPFQEKINQRLIAPDGASYKLSDVVDLIGAGSTLEERYQNALNAYNIFFDMYEKLTGLQLGHEGRSGELNWSAFKKVGAHYEVELYDKGTVETYNEKLKPIQLEDGSTEWTGGWEQNKPDKVKVLMSKERVAQFFSKIQSVLSYLEPILGTFYPRNGQGFLPKSMRYSNGEPIETEFRVRVDNLGMPGPKGGVQSGSRHYRAGIDIVADRAYLKTEAVQAKNQHVVKAMQDHIGKDMMGRMVFNFIQRSKWRQEKEEYERKYHEKKEEEFQKELEKRRHRNKRIKEENLRIKQQKKRKQELKEAENQSKAREAQRKKAKAEAEKRDKIRREKSRQTEKKKRK